MIQKICESNDIDCQLEGNYTKGCAISPDGLCILSSTASDNKLRLYNTPSGIFESKSKEQIDDTGIVKEEQKHRWDAVLTYQEGDSIRDYSWYPFMNSNDASTSFFLSTSKDQPIHLIDAYDASLKATYRAYNHLDELTSANVATFTPEGKRIVCGGFATDKRSLQVFDVEYPGRDGEIWRLGKSRYSSDGQKGMVSCISFSPLSNAYCGYGNVFAIGTYSPGSIYLYDDRLSSGVVANCNNAIILKSKTCIVGHGKRFTRKRPRDSQINILSSSSDDETKNEDFLSNAKKSYFCNQSKTGLTQISWSDSNNNGQLLFTSSRKSNAVLSWDVRNLCTPVRAYSRDGQTNQTLEFDILNSTKQEKQLLFLGSQDKSIKIYDTTSATAQSTKQIDTIDGPFCDAVNGVSVKELYDGSFMVAVATGARRWNCDFNTAEDDDVKEKKEKLPTGTLELYKYCNCSE